MKKVFHGLISKLNIADERNTELKDMSIETFKTEKQGEQKLKKEKKPEQNIQGLWENCKRCNICITEIE